MWWAATGAGSSWQEQLAAAQEGASPRAWQQYRVLPYTLPAPCSAGWHAASTALAVQRRPAAEAAAPAPASQASVPGGAVSQVHPEPHPRCAAALPQTVNTGSLFSATMLIVAYGYMVGACAGAVPVRH